MSNEPKYRGIRKGYSAIFVAWPKDHYRFLRDGHHRIRKQSSSGRWQWDYSSRRSKWTPGIPCWIQNPKSPYNYSNMRRYDGLRRCKTIFLGYVKEG